jgi:sec-independent protein translocase protein TatA
MADMFLFISGSEIVVIALAFLILFGSKKIPDMAKGLGKGLREFRKAADDIKREINQSSNGIDNEVRKIRRDIQDSTDKITDDLRKAGDDIAG